MRIFRQGVLSIIADASKGNDDKNDRECSPSLQMLGRDGNIMDGEYSPSLRCSRKWKYNGWRALSIMPAISVSKSCSANRELLCKWGALSIAFAHVTKKAAL
jgi:hypothetical protein